MNSNDFEILNPTLNDKNNDDFNKAVEIYENDYSHCDLIGMLQKDDVVTKQIATIKLKTIMSENEAEILVANLIGQEGKVRETASFRVKEFMSDNNLIKYFQNIKNYDIFLEAIIDINGNVCRNTISAVSNLRNNQEFCEYFSLKLTKKILPLITKVKEFDFQDGKYKINKEIFKLYWYLETIYEFCDFINQETLKQILTQTKAIKEYTIREKTAKILTKDFTDIELLQIKQDLKNDENYYVRRY